MFFCMYAGFLFASGPNNPMYWQGDTTEFIFQQDGGIRLNSERAGKSYLTSFSERYLNTSWEMNINMDFNSSSSNYIDIYLCTDASNPTESLNGYFLRIGHANDNISLYRKSSGRSYKVIEGIPKRLDFPFVDVYVKVTCTLSGEWEVYSRLNTEDFLVSEGKAAHYQPINVTNFGLLCVYTITRNKAFHIQNIRINILEENHENILVNTKEAGYMDVVFNEILFNGIEYIEFYNKSNSHIDLSGLCFTIRRQDGNIGKKYKLSTTPLILETNNFLVITKNKDNVCDRYFCDENAIFKELPDFPALNNSRANLVLLSTEDILIDEFIYSDKMHQELVTNKKNIALERINPFDDTQKEDNWQTASFEVGYGTPGYQNSQYRDEKYETIFEMKKDIFHTCEEEMMHLFYYEQKEMKESLQAHVYNSAGKRIKKLANNVITGAYGNLYWDGKDENGSQCQTGIYILYLEIIDLKGNIKKVRKVFTLNNC